MSASAPWAYVRSWSLLLCSQHRQLGRGAFEIFRQVLEQRFVVAEQLSHPELIEAVRAILDGNLERALTLGDEERQIELRRPQVQRDRFESSFPELWRGTGLLVDEHGLKDGVSVPLPWRRQLPRPATGRNRSVSEDLLQLPAEVTKGVLYTLLFVDEGGDHHRVEEVADHVRGGGVRARGDRRREGNVLTVGVSVQQQSKREGEHHERGGAGGGGESADARLHVRDSALRPGAVLARRRLRRVWRAGLSKGSLRSSGSGSSRRRQ